MSTIRTVLLVVALGTAGSLPAPAAAESATPAAAAVAVLDDAALSRAQTSARALAAGDTPKAAALAAEAKLDALSTEDRTAWLCRRGLWLIRLGQPKLAEQDYQAARKLSPDDTETLAGLAHTALLLQRRDEAQQLYDLARKPFGDTPPMNDLYSPGKQHLNLVSSLLADSIARFEAERFFTMELKGDAFYYAGKSEELAGHLEEAESLYREAVAEIPQDFPIARRALANVDGAGLVPAKLEPKDPNLGRMRQYVELCLKQGDLRGAESRGERLVAVGQDWPTFPERQRLWARVQAECFLASSGTALAHGVRALRLLAECDDRAAETTALRTRLWRELAGADKLWFRRLSPLPHTREPATELLTALQALGRDGPLPADDPRFTAAEAAWSDAWGTGPTPETLRDDAKRSACGELARIGAEIACLRWLCADAGSPARARADREAGRRLLLALLAEPEDLTAVRAVREHPASASLGLARVDSGEFARQLRVVPAYQRVADELLPLAAADFPFETQPVLGGSLCDRLLTVLRDELPPAAEAPWRRELVQTVWRLTHDPVRTCDVFDWAVQRERKFGEAIHRDWLPGALFQTPFGNAYLDAEDWIDRDRGAPAKMPASLAAFSTSPSLQVRLLQAKWMQSGDVVQWASDTVGVLKKLKDLRPTPHLMTSPTNFTARLLDRLELEYVDITLMPGQANAAGRPGQPADEILQRVGQVTRANSLLDQLEPLLKGFDLPEYVQQGVETRLRDVRAWVAVRIGDEANIKRSPTVWEDFSGRRKILQIEANMRAWAQEEHERAMARRRERIAGESRAAAAQARADAAMHKHLDSIKAKLDHGYISAAEAELARARQDPDLKGYYLRELDEVAENIQRTFINLQNRHIDEFYENRNYVSPPDPYTEYWNAKKAEYLRIHPHGRFW